MTKIVISPKADADLDDQFRVNAENNLDAAKRFLAAAEDAISLLSQMPDLGLSVPLHQIRFWPIVRFRNHLIFYRPIPDELKLSAFCTAHGIGRALSKMI